MGKPQDKEPQHNLKNIGTTEVEESTDVADNDDTDTDVVEQRPNMAAALKARDKVKAWTTYEMTCD